MRLTVCLLLLFAGFAMAEEAHSQNARVNLNKQHVQLRDVLEEIESQTDYLFISNRDIDLENRVSIRVQNKAVREVLDQLLRNTEISYAMEGVNIILSRNALPASPVIAQQRTVSGTVVDLFGEPIIGANIVEKGTTNGVVTDFNGAFTLSVPPSAVLQISYIGYIAQEIRADSQTSFHIILREDTQRLNEVVVIGYGTQKKADLTGSVANVNAEKLNTQSNVNLGLALQGKIAGVEIVTQGGSPGSGTKVMIRGIGTLNNANPLYIVDGMYMDNMDHINANDIASIDVLKDASSAAIYGSRAANGVVIITTKEGSNTEGKPIIDISANMGVQLPNKYLDLMNAAEWAQVTTVAREAINKPPLEMGLDLANKPDNDWQRIMLRPTLLQNYNASIKGGGNTYNYYTGIGYMNQDGIVKGTNYERFSVQFKANYNRGIFSAGNNIVMTSSHDAPHPAESRGGLLGSILQSVPTLEKYDENNIGGYGGSYGDVVNLNHPLGVMDKKLADRYNESQKVFINLYLQLEPIRGLKYKLNITPDFQFNRNMQYEGVFNWGLRTNDVTSMEESRGRWSNMLIEHLVSYDQTFGDHKLSALAGYTYQDNRYRYMVAKGKGMPAGLKEIDAATIERVNGGNSRRSVLTSILARVFYSYKNRYLITATIRRDGSSKFAKDNRYGNFPSASVGWNISEEGFMKSFDWLDQLKVRAGYGVLGNQEIGDYQYTSTITTGINYPDGYGSLLQGAFPKDFANPTIKWEETAMTNLGVDFVALHNRLSLTADYFIKKTKDILLSVPIPISSGGANDPVRNAGEIENRGFEFNLGWNDRPTIDFSYGMNLIGSFVKNEVTKMGTGSQVIWGGATVQNINTSRTLAGYPIAGFWLIPYDGIFRSEAELDAHSKDGKRIQPGAQLGDARFKDTNNDGQIDDEDRVYCGSPFPDVTLSLNGNVAYKNFDASIGLQATIGNKIYNATRQTLEDVTKGTNFLRTVLDYWTPQNPDASYPRLIWDDPNRNTRAESDRYLESGTYFRVRNVQVGYTFPKGLFDNKVEKARVYFNVENPFTITKYKGFSPDVNSGGTHARGFDYFIYPTNRVLMLGLNVTF